MAGLIDYEVRGVNSRGITQETAEHFRYGMGTARVGKRRNVPVQVAPYFDADGVMVAQHLRTADKEFPWRGDVDKAMPFGYRASRASGKMLVLTEGELDALAMSQAQGNQWPVWSIACGADTPEDAEGNPLPMRKVRKYISKHRDLFLRFERVIIMFDNDKQGRASARVAAEVIGPRAHIATLPMKDPADMLKAGRVRELLAAMWDAEPYRPDGIVALRDLGKAVLAPVERGLSTGFPTLDEWMYGQRPGELYAVGGATGGGKSDFLLQIAKHIIVEHKQAVGLFLLEQGVAETGKRLAGKYAGQRFHVPGAGWSDKQLEEAWAALSASGEVYLYDSFGINDWESIAEKMRFLHHNNGVRFFFLDHLTALAAMAEDERREVEEIMAQLAGLMKELDSTLWFVSHLATPEGKPHEEGGRVMLRHFKGSRAIGFWSYFAFGLERDQQAEDEETRQTTVLRCLKDRLTGQSTGKTCLLGYDVETGLIYEKDPVPTTDDVGFPDETEGDTDF